MSTYIKKHYKIIFAVIAAVGVLISVKSCIDRKKADLTIAYIGYDFIDKTVFASNSADLCANVGDIDGDGTARVAVMEISFSERLNDADFTNSQKKMASAVGSGAARVYLIDKAFAEKIKSSMVLAPLTEFADEGIKDPDGNIVAVDISDNPRLKEMGVSDTEDMYLALRVVSEMDVATNKRIGEIDAAARRAVKWILESSV